MKRFVRLISTMVLLVLVIGLLPVYASAANGYIDVSTSSEGFFTVDYSDGTSVKMKVGIKFAGSTSYFDYFEGSRSTFSFNKGDGSYTITLFRNVSGTSYKTVETKSVNVKLQDEFSQYTVSTTEITFSATDSVGKKAAELCSGKSTDEEKAAAFFNYITDNFTYDYDLANDITSGLITVYVPSTSDTLSAKTGICYDFSALYAALCRSQGIPCVITKGYYQGSSHAWNKVYINGGWYAVDLTYSISYNTPTASSIADCVSPITTYTDCSDNIPLASIPTSKAVASRFTDVSVSAWYYEYVTKAASLGLVSGTTTSTFAPNAKMKLCEAIKLAALVYSDYVGDGESFKSNGGKWYAPYVDYAIENGIISSGYSDYGAYATRAQFAEILANALPDEALAAVHTVANGSIPDVSSASSYNDAVYKLYRAGVISGGSDGSFNPASGITRAEVAAIIIRMVDSSARV